MDMKGRKLRNNKFILVRYVCADCGRHEGQLNRDEKWWCVKCYAKKYGEVTVKMGE